MPLIKFSWAGGGGGGVGGGGGGGWGGGGGAKLICSLRGRSKISAIASQEHQIRMRSDERDKNNKRNGMMGRAKDVVHLPFAPCMLPFPLSPAS